MSSDCPLCAQDGGQCLVRHSHWRIVLADEPEFPGFTRVIWNDHTAEMTDLSPAVASALMQTVFDVERLMREHLAPDKVNLASLGNLVPHLHWHIVPRFTGDSRFPDPVWAPAQREAQLPDLTARLDAYIAALSRLKSA